MAFIVDEETGNITLVQGDSGKYSVENVPCDKNYTAYFGIYNDKRKPVGFEIYTNIEAQTQADDTIDGGDETTPQNDLYAWSYEDDTIYTLNETPLINDVIYNSQNEALDTHAITSINTEDDIVVSIEVSIIGEENDILFERNRLEDIVADDDTSDDDTTPVIPDTIPTTNIEFTIPASLTDYLTVKRNEETAEYYFGIKLCSEDGDEDTLLLGNSQIGDLNTITVYPKKLEGTVNG